MSTPPAAWNASKTVTSWPCLTSSPAAVSPAGPEPTMATDRPEVAGASGFDRSGWAIAQSATNRSREPIATEAPFLARTQRPSHWISCGQTRPVTQGRALSSRSDAAAPSMSPTRSRSMNSGMLTRTGQPSMQTGFLHWRQRSASSIASCCE